MGWPIPKQTAKIFRLFMRLDFKKIESEEGGSAIIAPWNTYYHCSGGGYRKRFPRIVVTFAKTGNSYEAYNVPKNEEAEEDAEKLVDPRWATLVKERTVEDFKRCGPSSHNDYGFPHINSCVGSEKNKKDFLRLSGGNHKCKESNAPVPCGDGSCQSDYISCLTVLSKLEQSGRNPTDAPQKHF